MVSDDHPGASVDAGRVWRPTGVDDGSTIDLDPHLEVVGHSQTVGALKRGQRAQHVGTK
jgi:hypothetical protein